MTWLDRFDSAWVRRPLWALFCRKKDTGHPQEEMLSVFREFGVVPKSARPNLNQTAENRDIYQLVGPGWLVVNRMKAWQGSVGVSPRRGIVSGHYVCFEPRHDEDSRYLNWLLRSSPYASEFQRLSRGVRPGQQEIDNERLRLLPIVVPPKGVQRAIADYLDHETARIDELIAEQEALLPRLDQRRASELDEVMSSLGPPDRRLKQLSTTQTGLTLGKDHASGEELPYLRVANVQAGSLDLDDVSTVLASASERQRHSLRDGDVLMTEGGDLDKLGRGAVWRGQIEPCLHQNHVFAVRCGKTLQPDFLAFWMESAVARRYFRDSAKKTTNLASINATILGNLPLSLPPLDRQDEIVSALRNVVRSTSRLRQEVDGLIALLKERRAALITAAVTGELDVPTP